MRNNNFQTLKIRYISYQEVVSSVHDIRDTFSCYGLNFTDIKLEEDGINVFPLGIQTNSG